MSKLCIGTIKNLDITTINQLKDQIKSELSFYGLSVYYELTYEEPFLEEYIDKNDLIFSISDDDFFDNCEMLLLPDGFFYGTQTNEIAFKERMKNLKNVFEKILEKTSKFDLFIGNSGTALFEFENFDIKIKDFVKIATHYINSIEPIDLHLLITK